MNVLALRGLAKSYGSIQALRGITATIDGQRIGLLGANGAGKSTLLKCLLGLLPHEGRATLFGLDTQNDALEVRKRVGYMPERDSYLQGMSAVELCAYAAELSGLPKSEALQRAHAALYYAGLEDKRYQPVDDYSTGMKQRVKLAQALVHDPDLLFLDEPTNGLDPAAREEMLDLIRGLPDKRGCHIMLSTHLLPDVDRICDTVVVLAEGQLRFSGSIAELRKETGAQVYDVEVKAEPETLARALEAEQCMVRLKDALGLAVTLPSGKDTRLILEVARRTGSQVRGLALERESLEQAFLRVVQAASN